MSKNIGVSQSDRLSPKIHQNTQRLKFSIGEDNLNGKFGLSLTGHDMPLHDPGRKKSVRSVKGVHEGYWFRRGRLRAVLPTSPPVRRSFSPFITPTALTANTTFIATTTIRFTTLRLTSFDGPILVLRNCPMGVFACGMGLTHARGAIGDNPINAVVHIRLFTFFAMFGTRNPNELIGRRRCRPVVGGFPRLRFRLTHGVDGGISQFGSVRVRRSIRINRIHRGFMGRRAMGVGHRRPFSSIETTF